MRKLFFIMGFIAFGRIAFAQDIILTNDGKTIKGYNTDSSKDWVYYTSDPEGSSYSRISKTRVCSITLGQRNKAAVVEQSTNKTKTNSLDSIVDEINNYHGFLLAKGNNVYVLHKSKEKYVKVGQDVILGCLQKSEFWHVVDNPNLAHFAVEYAVDTHGSDYASLNIRYWIEKRKDGKPKWLEYKVADKMRRVNEDYGNNKELAYTFYDELEKLMQSIDKGKIPRELKKAER